jgi:hypothetical protein
MRRTIGLLYNSADSGLKPDLWARRSHAKPSMAITPVAFFAYNRPDHAERALTALARCEAGNRFEFHFFADGAKSAADTARVEATRVRLRAWAPHFGARVVERNANAGLAHSIAEGVSALCALHGRVVVVEDDLVVSPDFLRFMGDALDRYADEPRVMQVGGCTLSPPAGVEADAFLLPITTSWGWGTWARAWKKFEWSPSDVADMKADAAWTQRFNFGGAYAYTDMLDARLAGRNDSWAILWWYAVARQQGLVAYPARNLVWNGGFDGSGVHCDTSDLFDVAGLDGVAGRWLPETVRFPEGLEVDPAHSRALEDFFRKLAGPASGTPMVPGARARLGHAWRTFQRAIR